MTELLARWATIAAACAGVIGGIAGLVIGLHVYAPTAWFATFEVGIPSAVAGALLGAVAGSVVLVGRRLRH